MDYTLLHKKIQWKKYACVISNFFPNLGPNGLSIVIVNKNIINPRKVIPVMSDFSLFIVF